MNNISKKKNNSDDGSRESEDGNSMSFGFGRLTSDFGLHKVVSLLLMAILILLLSSCNRRLMSSGQSAHLPSSYTHGGKYIKYNSIVKSRSGIKRYNQKCHISSMPK